MHHTEGKLFRSLTLRYVVFSDVLMIRLRHSRAQGAMGRAKSDWKAGSEQKDASESL